MNDERDSRYATILATDFERASGIPVVEVKFNDEDETIHVITHSDSYTFQIGSDDDEFIFENDRDEGNLVRFPLSAEWLALEEEQF